MKKQAERKTHLGTPKASYRALVCREILVGILLPKTAAVQYDLLSFDIATKSEATEP